MAARRFLWIIATLIVLAVAAAFAWRLFGQKILVGALVPTIDFAQSPQSPAPDYGQAASWVARPGKPSGALWSPPEGIVPAPVAPPRRAAVFFVTPTAYLARARWNLDLADATANAPIPAYLKAQASALSAAGDIWAPAYRQAAFGAFLVDTPDSRAAIDFAWRDVERAWDAFLAANPDGPIILAGHSQGSLHLGRLLAQRIAGRPEAARIAAAYLPGWPISVEADLPALGLPACGSPTQAGCVMSWMSFAEPADGRFVREAFERQPGWTGRPRAGTAMLCTNPLRGLATEAPAVPAANPGALAPLGRPDAEPVLRPSGPGARCAQGLLLIGAPPEGYDANVMPGNNYHVYDWHLFWAALRADAVRRVAAWEAAQAR
ncbi:MAG: DUF3089 domain-containing protein [Sphingomonadaceae bacterium]